MTTTNVPENVEPKPLALQSQSPVAAKTVIEDQAEFAKEAGVPQWALAGAMVGEGWAQGKAVTKDEVQGAVSKFMAGPLYREA